MLNCLEVGIRFSTGATLAGSFKLFSALRFVLLITKALPIFLTGPAPARLIRTGRADANVLTRVSTISLDGLSSEAVVKRSPCPFLDDPSTNTGRIVVPLFRLNNFWT